jgi:hypothetical protein
MTTSRLPRVGQTIEQMHKQEEEGVKANSAEATRLYQRGVAAARGGQRRIAAGLLTRSVQLDPNNEGAWLWLSGVIDDPHQIAFCLHSVLKLNPANERARQGLRWLEERQLLKGNPQPAPLLDINVGEPAAQRSARQQTESWWVNWRKLRRDTQRVSLLLWSVPLVLLFLALLLHQAFSLAVEQARTDLPIIPTIQQQPTPEMRPLLVAMPTPEQQMNPTPVPVLESELSLVQENRTIAYLSEISPIRQQLRDAVENYRSTTGKPGSAAISHATAAQNLRSSVEKAQAILQRMTPPPKLQDAHNDYLQGLELELDAIDSLVEFYGSYEVEHAHIAASRFQEANNYFSRARAAFDIRMEQIQRSSSMSSFTIR